MYMRLALDIAKVANGQTSPNPLVGAVIVKDGRVVGQGAHLLAGGPHAEVHAIRMAGDAARDATIYVTLEPCNHYGRTPPCTEAIISAGIRRVVVGSVDANPLVHGEGLKRLRDAGIEVVTSVLEDEAKVLNEAFFHYMTTKRPFIIWKCASTLDGFTAADSGHSQYVTGSLARDYVQALRREIPAIAVGINTVLTDNPRLTVRDEHGPLAAKAQPLRVIFDSQLRIPLSARLLSEPGRTVIVTTKDAFAAKGNQVHDLQTIKDVSVIAVKGASGRSDLPDAFSEIAKLGITSLLLEGGATLAAACLKEKLIDKVVYFLAPKLLGSGFPALSGATTEHMENAVTLGNVTCRQFGPDFCIEGYPIYNAGL